MPDELRHLTATPEEIRQAKAAIESAVWDEIHRVVKAIRVDGELGVQPKLSIRLDRFSGGPALRIEEDEVEALTLAKLNEIVGQDLQIELQEGRIELTSPSWPPDRIPF